MSTGTASADDHSRFVWLLHSTMRSIKSTEIKKGLSQSVLASPTAIAYKCTKKHPTACLSSVSYGRNFIVLRTAICFHTDENPFSCGRKSIFIRRKQAKVRLRIANLLGQARQLLDESCFLLRYSEISMEEIRNSSELRNRSSEVSFHSSELLFRPSVGILAFLRAI